MLFVLLSFCALFKLRTKSKEIVQRLSNGQLGWFALGLQFCSHLPDLSYFIYAESRSIDAKSAPTSTVWPTDWKINVWITKNPSLLYKNSYIRSRLLCLFWKTLSKCLKSTVIGRSVADPDPDPVFFGHPDPGKYRIRILYPQKDPMLFGFSRFKIV